MNPLEIEFCLTYSNKTRVDILLLSLRNDIFIYITNTHALAVVLIKFLALLQGTKLLTIEYCLVNETKHFYCVALSCFLVIFLFCFNCAGSVGESACRNFS